MKIWAFWVVGQVLALLGIFDLSSPNCCLAWQRGKGLWLNLELESGTEVVFLHVMSRNDRLLDGNSFMCSGSQMAAVTSTHAQRILKTEENGFTYIQSNASTLYLYIADLLLLCNNSSELLSHFLPLITLSASKLKSSRVCLFPQFAGLINI